MSSFRTRTPVRWAALASSLTGAVLCLGIDQAGGGARQRAPAPATTLSLESAVVGLAYSSDGQLLACALADGPPRLLDGATGKEIRRLEGVRLVLSHVRFLPGDRALLAASVNTDRVSTWLVPSGRLRDEVPVRQKGIAALAVSDDGRRLATAACDGAVWVWEQGAAPHASRVPAAPALDVALSPDGEILATGHKDRTVCLWDAASGRRRCVLTGHEGWVRRVAFSPDGQLLASAGDDRMLVLWEVATAQPIRRHGPHFSSLHSLAFAPDGLTLAVGNRRGGVQLWDLTTGRERLTLVGHRGEVAALVFSPDSRTLASGGGDRSVKLRRLPARPADSRPGVPLNVKDLERYWTHLAGGEVVQGYEAIRALVAAPAQAVPFLAEKLRAAGAVPRTVDQLIADLESARYAVRRQATQRLIQLGKAAEPNLKKALVGPLALESRRRIERILSGEGRQDPLPPEAVRELRSVQVLEKIGNVQARSLLQHLVGRPTEFWSTHPARAALDRVARRLRLAAERGTDE